MMPAANQSDVWAEHQAWMRAQRARVDALVAARRARFEARFLSRRSSDPNAGVTQHPKQ